MYAIIEVGAKRYTVQKDDIIEVEKQEGAKDGALSLDKVLMVCDGDKIEVGQPYLKGASVIAKVLGQIKGEKKISFKYRRRKASHSTKGHRQQLTRIKITEINVH